MILDTLTFVRESQSVIRFSPGGIENLSEAIDPLMASNVVLVADADVHALYGIPVQKELERLFGSVTTFLLPSGEASKSRQSVADIQDLMNDQRIDRKGLIVGLGGGVALDVAGYVAATYLRGIDWIALPTSLLAQVDAGIGGKTAINTTKGKNLIGAFHPPRHVIIDPEVLASLPPIEWRNGLVEAIKHAWISDAELFGEFEKLAPWLNNGPSSESHEWMKAAVRVKTSVIAEDPYEQGRRAMLNAGHTVGHGIETATDHSIRHGFAVARGMVVEARAAHHATGLSVEDIQRLEGLLQELDLLPPTTGIAFESLLPFMLRDKKNQKEQIRIALPSKLGQCQEIKDAWTVAISLDELHRAWETFR